MSRAFTILRQISSTPGSLPLRSFPTTLVTSARGTEQGLVQSLLSLYEPSNCLPERSWGQQKVLLHSFPELPHPCFCFTDYWSCSPLGRLVPGLLLQETSGLTKPARPPSSVSWSTRNQCFQPPTRCAGNSSWGESWRHPGRVLNQMFPVHPVYMFGFTRSVQQPHLSSDPTYHQVVIRFLSLHECAIHLAAGLMIRPSS